VALAAYGELFDTMSVCLSKGLGAPVGSLVLMSNDAMVPTARAIRRRLGGGMRQAGILAAAGRHALDHHLERLADDHARARRLADAVASVRPELVETGSVETNIVVLDLGRVDDAAPRPGAADVAAAAREHGVLLSVLAP